MRYLCWSLDRGRRRWWPAGASDDLGEETRLADKPGGLVLRTGDDPPRWRP
jgi:hypothetical protein